MKSFTGNIGFGIAFGVLSFMVIAALLMCLDRSSNLRSILESFFSTINHPIESMMDIDDNEMLKGVFVYLMWWGGIGGLAAFLFSILDRSIRSVNGGGCRISTKPRR